MSDLNEQPGLFDDIDQAPSDELLYIPEPQNEIAVTNTITEVPLLEYLLAENRLRVVDVKLAELLVR